MDEREFVYTPASCNTFPGQSHQTTVSTVLQSKTNHCCINQSHSGQYSAARGTRRLQGAPISFWIPSPTSPPTILRSLVSSQMSFQAPDVPEHIPFSVYQNWNPWAYDRHGRFPCRRHYWSTMTQLGELLPSSRNKKVVAGGHPAFIGNSIVDFRVIYDLRCTSTCKDGFIYVVGCAYIASISSLIIVYPVLFLDSRASRVSWRISRKNLFSLRKGRGTL